MLLRPCQPKTLRNSRWPVASDAPKHATPPLSNAPLMEEAAVPAGGSGTGVPPVTDRASAGGASNAAWWVQGGDGQTYGPYTRSQLNGFVTTRAVSAGQLVFGPDTNGWQPASVLGVAIAPPPPPPLPPSSAAKALSDPGTAAPALWAWMCALGPILGALAGAFVGGMLWPDPFSQVQAINDGSFGIAVLIVALAVNSGLAAKDVKTVQQSGYPEAKLGMIFLVPYWLFKRAQIVGERPVYGFAWIAALLVSLFI